MKKMTNMDLSNLKKFLLAICFLLVLNPFLNSQIISARVDSLRNTVIAKNGLNIRSSPSLNSRIIGNIPYKGNATVIGSYYMGFDTILISSKSEGWNQYYYLGRQEIAGYGKYIVAGNWVEVEYNNIIGYVNDAYLARIKLPVNCIDDSDVNSNVLFYNSLNQIGFLYADPYCYKWYSVNQTGGEFTITEISDLGMISTYTDYGGPGITLYSDSLYNSLYVIGVKNFKLKTGVISGQILDENLLYKNYRNDLDNDFYLNSDFMDENNISYTSKTGNPFKQEKLIIKENGIQQELEFRDGNKEGKPMSVIFVGDLDGDDRMDYITKFANKFSSYWIYSLHLSSQRSRGKLVKLSAYFEVYYD
ncbi:hypothetical protein CEQ90_20465 [Lewinellaceae bacterium SD302]|nr:hypothetical protein CEQ90_20465 [Lewinellaceae bacterium SD302]